MSETRREEKGSAVGASQQRQQRTLEQHQQLLQARLPLGLHGSCVGGCVTCCARALSLSVSLLCPLSVGGGRRRHLYRLVKESLESIGSYCVRSGWERKFVFFSAGVRVGVRDQRATRRATRPAATQTIRSPLACFRFARGAP